MDNGRNGTDVGTVAVQWAQQTSGVGESRLLEAIDPP